MTHVVFCVLVVKATCASGADCEEGEHLGREFPWDVALLALDCALRSFRNKNRERVLKFPSVLVDPTA